MKKSLALKAKEFIQTIGTIGLVLTIITIGGMIIVVYSTIMVKTFQLVYKLDLIKFIQR